MLVVGEVDESAVGIVVDLFAHFGFDLLEDVFGIWNEEVVRANFVFFEVLVMIVKDGWEIVFFAGEVVPERFWRSFERGRKRIVCGVNGSAVRGVGRDSDKGESNAVVFAEADCGHRFGFGVPKEAEVLVHPDPVPSGVGDVFEFGFFDFVDESGGVGEVVFVRESFRA